MAVTGVDVSKNQPSVDWRAVSAAGYRFAYIKATEGVDYVEDTLDGHHAGARGAGLVTGLYHMGRPDTNSPEQDAADFAKQLQRLNAAGPGNLPPCLDSEKYGGGYLRDWVKQFITSVRQHTGRQEVMVYASSSWIREHLTPENWRDPGVFLWIAEYSSPPGQPEYRNERVVMHQHSRNEPVAGIPQPSDANVAMADLRMLTGGGAPPEPPPAPHPQPQPPQQPPAPPQQGTYTVRPGESLSSIGQKLGLSWQEIAQANGINDPNQVQAGQVLRLPARNGAPAGPETYTVQAGDNLAGIGQKVGLSWQEVARANGIADPNTIYPGQTLRIPR